jgi:ribosomal-protein-alanine N-acetyltransferase
MLAMRPIAAGDAAAVHELLGDPEVAAWLRPAAADGPFGLDECAALAARGAAHWAAHGFGRTLAFDGDRCVGWSLLGHTIVAGRAEVEIGWTVASDRWGRGLATELGADALRRARSLGLERVVAFTRRDNVRSQRVMEKLGLELEREFDYAGLPHVLFRAGPPAPADSS